MRVGGIDQGELCDVHYWQDKFENTFKPDYNTEAVLVEEMQRMAAEHITKDEALKIALEFIEHVNRDGWILADFEPAMYEAIAAIKEALSPKQV
jgi:hypothetical protein